MSKEQAEWLDQCPLILTAKDVHALGDIAVVHGGLVPGVELEQQNPNSIMNSKILH
jgi:diadenosine tetraphosphatase ApaH/serine/threonine PP2A family protein phosphatase